MDKTEAGRCGKTTDEARRNIQDAVKGFLETAEEMGTLNDVLEESGYRFEQGHWDAPKFIALDHFSVGLGQGSCPRSFQCSSSRTCCERPASAAGAEPLDRILGS